MGGAARRFICWDMDETLGNFRPPDDKLASGRRGAVRGISTLLEAHRKTGSSHVLTTAAEASYAEQSLSEFGLRGYFDAVFDRSVICDPHFNKNYSAVVSRLGVDPSEAAERVLVVGNLGKDAPSDTDLVFLYHPSAVLYGAEAVGDILAGMMEFGSWKSAYDFLSRGEEGRISMTTVENYENERLLLHIEGKLAGLESGTILVCGSCSMSSIGPDSIVLFSRSVRRLIYVLSVPDRFLAEPEPVSGVVGLLPAVNQ